MLPCCVCTNNYVAMRLPTAPTQRGWQEHAARIEKECSTAAFGSSTILYLSADSDTRHFSVCEHSSLTMLENSSRKNTELLPLQYGKTTKHHHQEKLLLFFFSSSSPLVQSDKHSLFSCVIKSECSYSPVCVLLLLLLIGCDH